MSTTDIPLAPEFDVPLERATAQSGAALAALISFPASFIDKCFIPYDEAAPPSINGLPVILGSSPVDVADDPCPGSILLAPGLIAAARAMLGDEFTAAEAAKAAKGCEPSQTLRISALCGAHLDAPLAVDAAARYLAHSLQADLVTLDPDDLGSGMLGSDFSATMWHLYEQHYQAEDQRIELDVAQSKAKDASHDAQYYTETVEERRAAVEEHKKNKEATKSYESDAEGKGVQRLGQTELGDIVDSVGDEKLQDLLESLAAAEASLATAKETVTTSIAEVKRLVKRNAADAEARQSATAQSFAWLTALLSVARPSGLPDTSRRRMVYFRDFGTLSYIFRPLLQALVRAMQDSQETVIVVAGIWRYERLPYNSATDPSVPKQSARKHRSYLSAFEGNQSLKGWLERKFPATWRSSSRSGPRFANLEDSIAACFAHRFGNAELYSRRFTHAMSVDGHVQMTYVHSLAVGLLGARCNELGKRWGREERERRLVAHNMRALSKALHGVGRKVDLSSLYDVRLQDVTTRSQACIDFVRDVRGSIMSFDQVSTLGARLAPWLRPDTTTSAAFLLAIDQTSVMAQELHVQVATATEKVQLLTADVIVEEVKNADDLDEYERSLLGSIIDPTTIKTVYADVCIQPHVIDTLRSVISLPLLFPDAHRTGILGTESMSGVLLYGPPGTGKTMICRAVAKESGACMLQIQASNMKSKWHSESEKLIHAAFTLARRLGPCVVFIDEIDALFCRRGSGDDHLHRSMLTEFMQEMDGLKTSDENRNNRVVVIGATNRPQDLDDAVLRRLPRRVLVDLPGLSEREKILAQYLRGETVDPSVNLTRLAKRTVDFSGSDLKHLVYSAALAAFKDTVPNFGKPVETGCEAANDVPQRVLRAQNFDHALQEITASCASNMDGVRVLRAWGGSLGKAMSARPRTTYGA